MIYYCAYAAMFVRTLVLWKEQSSEIETKTLEDVGDLFNRYFQKVQTLITHDALRLHGEGVSP